MRKLAVVAIAAVVVLAGAVSATAASRQAARQIVPAAASTAGSDSSHWRTDLTLHNPSGEAAQVVLEIIPSGLAHGHADPESVALPSLLGPSETIVVADVLGTYFPDHRTGALVVLSLDHHGRPVEIAVTSRTWSPAADGQGSFGQGIPTLPWTNNGDLYAADPTLSPLEASDAFRSNLGLVNPTRDLEETFEIDVYDASGALQGTLSYTLPPRTHLQRDNFLGELGLEGSGYTATVRLVSWNQITPGVPGITPVPDFVTYGSRIDRRTNDPTYVEPQTEITTIGPDRIRVIPVTASTPGQAGSHWSTGLTIHHPADEGRAYVAISAIPSGGEGYTGELPWYFTNLQPRQTKVLEDVLGEHFPDLDAAALLVRSFSTSQPVLDVRVDSRTWTPAADGDGSLGQGIPGLPMAAGADPMVVPGLEASAAFRSNLGMANLSSNVRLTFNVNILDASGSSQGILAYPLDPRAHLQVNGILDELGLTGSGYTALITLSDLENLYLEPSDSWEPMVAAYGSRVDQYTNDPTYIAPISLADAPPPAEGDWYDFERYAPWYLCPDEALPDEATVVTAFDQAYHYWGGGSDERSITQEVEFPASSDWNQVGLYLHLECPENGLCDHWDRSGSLQLVLNPDDPQQDWEYLEIMRHITPYRIGMCEYVDITPLAPLLTGRQTLVSWIDTWVGPGHDSGEGWRITFDFVFYPGEPRQADQVLNVWGRRNLVIGNLDPEHTVDAQLDPVTVTIPADASRVEARLITTGHAFGNSDNCAEFCVLRQDVYVNGQRRSVLPWRTDCEYNPTGPQAGTWEYDRNGWCPGAIATGHGLDISDLVTPGGDTVIDFDVRTQDGEEFENTIHADLEPYEWISLKLYVWTD